MLFVDSFLLWLLTLPFGVIQGIINTDCCSDCLMSDAMKGTDALNFDACGQANEGCCFEPQCHMSRLGLDFVWSPDMAFVQSNDNNTMPVIDAGRDVKLQWPQATRLTYIIMNEGQAKLNQPKNTSSEARYELGWFHMCAQNPGSLYFRAWADEDCTASQEFQVQVRPVSASSSTESCARPSRAEDRAPAQVQDNKIECNLNRATVTATGECVCTSDWAGAPACSDLPVWKWIITIGGGLAALVSIAVSVYTFLERRKRMRYMDRTSSFILQSTKNDDKARWCEQDAVFTPPVSTNNNEFQL